LEPGDGERRIFIWNYIEVGELARMLGVKPYKVVAQVLELGIFRHADEVIDFTTAATIASRHGFVVERIF
jgi:translation initiation factor IF-2